MSHGLIEKFFGFFEISSCIVYNISMLNIFNDSPCIHLEIEVLHHVDNVPSFSRLKSTDLLGQSKRSYNNQEMEIFPKEKSTQKIMVRKEERTEKMNDTYKNKFLIGCLVLFRGCV